MLLRAWMCRAFTSGLARPRRISGSSDWRRRCAHLRQLLERTYTDALLAKSRFVPASRYGYYCTSWLSTSLFSEAESETFCGNDGISSGIVYSKTKLTGITSQCLCGSCSPGWMGPTNWQSFLLEVRMMTFWLRPTGGSRRRHNTHCSRHSRTARMTPFNVSRTSSQRSHSSLRAT
jgi:hypothetical protein